MNTELVRTLSSGAFIRLLFTSRVLTSAISLREFGLLRRLRVTWLLESMICAVMMMRMVVNVMLNSG